MRSFRFVKSVRLMNENCSVWDYKVKFTLWKGDGLS